MSWGGQPSRNVSDKVALNSYDIGRVIGPRGGNIKLLEQHSDCKIKTPPKKKKGEGKGGEKGDNDDPEEEQFIEIFGPTEE